MKKPGRLDFEHRHERSNSLVWPTRNILCLAGVPLKKSGRRISCSRRIDDAVFDEARIIFPEKK